MNLTFLTELFLTSIIIWARLKGVIMLNLPWERWARSPARTVLGSARRQVNKILGTNVYGIFVLILIVQKGVGDLFCISIESLTPGEQIPKILGCQHRLGPP